MPAVLFVTAFLCELVDSTLGMGYGTALAPILICMGYNPVHVITEHPFMRVYYGKGFRAVVTGMLDPLLLNELGYQPDPVWATGEGV